MKLTQDKYGFIYLKKIARLNPCLISLLICVISILPIHAEQDKPTTSPTPNATSTSHSQTSKETDTNKNTTSSPSKVVLPQITPSSPNLATHTNDPAKPNQKANNDPTPSSAAPVIDSSNTNTDYKPDNLSYDPTIDSATAQNKNTNFYFSSTPSGKYVFYKWHGSLMYDSNAISLLNTAIDDYISSLGHANTHNNSSLNNLLGVSNKPWSSPSFYLNSIIFDSPASWVMWINNLKVTYEQGKNLESIIPDINLVSITSKAAVFRWVTPFLDYMAPNWRAKLLYAGVNEFVSADKTIIVQERRDSTTVTFTLAPNQTFVVHDLEIAEGYVPPTIISNKPATDLQRSLIPSIGLP